MSKFAQLRWKWRNSEFIINFDLFFDLSGPILVSYFRFAYQVLFVLGIWLTSSTLWITFENLMVSVLILHVWLLGWVMKIEKARLDEKWRKSVKRLFSIISCIAKWRRGLISWETWAIIERIVDGYSFLFFSDSIIVLYHSFTDHKLIIFWIILASAFGAREGLVKREMRLIGIVGVILSTLVWGVFVSV